MRVVVRNLDSHATHLADVEHTAAALIFGHPCRKPPAETVTLCDTAIADGVVMREGTPILCRACKAAQ